MPSFELTPQVRRIVLATVALSIGGGIADAWLGLPVTSLVGLTPTALWGAGDVLPGVPALWQLATYPFFALSPFDLVFGALAYGWFAGDLERVWGGKLFLDRFWTLAIVVGVATVLASLAFPSLRDFTLIGPSPVLEGLVIAWGLTFPHRTIRIFLLIPITGLQMAWLTIALTALAVVFGGPAVFPFLVPVVTAIALGFAFANTGFSLGRVSLLVRRWRVQRELDRERARRRHRDDDAGPTLH